LVQTQGRQVLPDSIHPGVFPANPISGDQFPTTQSMNLAISLPLRNQAKLNDTLADLYNPAKLKSGRESLWSSGDPGVPHDAA